MYVSQFFVVVVCLILASTINESVVVLLCFKAQEVCGSFESESMIDSIKMLDNELIEIKQAAAAATLKPLPGETVREIFFKASYSFLKLTRYSTRSRI